MQKTICDICKTNEAAEHFRVQQSKKYKFPWGEECRYQYIDVCQDCYDKLTAHIPKPEPSPLRKAFEQFKNAPPPISVTLFGIVMLVKLEQPENAELPMLVTLLGIVILCMLEHS